jgi:murein DD-endopeptidase MepM/ murein hydrolase activator NlpD
MSLLLASGCATSPPASTWDNDPPPPVARIGPRAAPRPTARPSPRLRTASQDVELALLKFVSRRKELAMDLAPARRWPAAMEALWLDLLGRIEVQLSDPDAVVPRRLLIQARVTTEAERELTERRFGPCSPLIKERLLELFVLITAHMRRMRSPIEQARLDRSAPELWWPVAPVLISSGFGYRRDPIHDQDVRFHSGIDLAGQDGDLVIASGPGRVIHSGWLGGYGLTVIVQHSSSFQTLYGHLGEVLAPLGSEVDGGSPLGFMGSSGRSTGPHLHFEVRRAGLAIDPHQAIGVRLAQLEDELR